MLGGHAGINNKDTETAGNWRWVVSFSVCLNFVTLTNKEIVVMIIAA